jgi:hypothetical protein
VHLLAIKRMANKRQKAYENKYQEGAEINYE